MRIVVIPTQGLANRLRAIASARVLADFMNTTFHMVWVPEAACNCTFDSLFDSPRIPTINIDTDVASKTYLYKPNVHTSSLLQENLPLNAYDFLVIRGGHEFRHPHMTEDEFVARKCAFYGTFVPKDSIQQQVLTPPGPCVAIHFRDFIPCYDAADGRDFSQVSPLHLFVERVRTMSRRNPRLHFLLCSNTNRAYEALNEVLPTGRLWYRNSVVQQRDSAKGIADALTDIIAMSRCDLILGTSMSSFSDEACFWGETLKLCIGDDALKQYHCHGWRKLCDGESVVLGLPEIESMQRLHEFIRT